MLTDRVRCERTSTKAGKCVIYVMSRDQRTRDNHALLAAQARALTLSLPLAVLFCVKPMSGYRSREHYEFMIAGLRQVERELEKCGIPLIVLIGEPIERLQGFIHHTDPESIFFDFSPLKGPRSLVAATVASVESNIFVVDTHNIVPVWIASGKQEVGARTLRSKLSAILEPYLHEPDTIIPHPIAWPGVVKPIVELENLIQDLLHSLPASGIFLATESGESAAHAHLADFIRNDLHRYASERSDPAAAAVSGLSPYVHFGQLSTLRIALAMREVARKQQRDLHILESPKMPQPTGSSTVLDGINAFLEEAIVRKELSDNFCYYTKNYTSLNAAPTWAVASLRAHRSDQRSHHYSVRELLRAETHDSAWNAAQKQLISSGKMHGYMRMYWAKKILEWSPAFGIDQALASTTVQTSLLEQSDVYKTDTITPHGVMPENTVRNEQIVVAVESKLSKLSDAQWAIAVTIFMNDFYSIDGGDPNGYVGILWAIAGVHDRPWSERAVFGMVRYMNYAGLRRKFAIADYERTWLANPK